jgi:LmbE family N-acetylglucosaminyl deacetylase
VAHHSGDLGTLVAVFAHPDDEAYLASGLMALAVDDGRRVVCVTATKGELGFPHDDPRSVRERTALREAEMRACLDVLGVREHVWLDQPDGGCAGVDPAGPVGRLREVIDDVRPDTILTFGPDGQTFHPDHIAVSRWTTLAAREAASGAALLYAAATPEWAAAFDAIVPLAEVMMTDDEPPTVPGEELAVWFRCDDELAARKVDALRCHASQTGPLIELMGPDGYLEINRDEMFRAAGPDDWPAPPT